MRLQKVVSKRTADNKTPVCLHLQASESNVHRKGYIKKEIQFDSESAWQDKSSRSTIGIGIDTYEKIIEVQQLFGAAPRTEDVFLILLADRDVRRLVKKYQEGKRVHKYKLWTKEGMSGNADVFISIGKKKGSFVVTETKKLLHISCYGKLNEGFGDECGRMYVGDFVELIAFSATFTDFTEEVDLSLSLNELRKLMRKNLNTKYIVPKLWDEWYDCEKRVHKII